LAACFSGNKEIYSEYNNEPGSGYSDEAKADEVIPYNTDYPAFTETAESNSTLSVLHLTHGEFIDSAANPRMLPGVPGGRVYAGVIPHHNTAATLISGFFARAARHAEEYDLVIILAPNHFGDIANVVLSDRDWDIGGGVFTCRGFVNDLMAERSINSAINHSRMELDHSASILIPYIYHYLPGVKVAPLLLNRAMTFNETLYLSDWLNDWIEDSGLNVLLIASIDFSHFLNIPQSRQMDAITREAIMTLDLLKIHAMTDQHLDSAAAMILYLRYLHKLGIQPHIAAHTDASVSAKQHHIW
jgi:AmmeMemoRadiSam system protein B